VRYTRARWMPRPIEALCSGTLVEVDGRRPPQRTPFGFSGPLTVRAGIAAGSPHGTGRLAPAAVAGQRPTPPLFRGTGSDSQAGPARPGKPEAKARAAGVATRAGGVTAGDGRPP
jgi:hypothetical protein